jgi:hypothetical protein
VKKTKKKKQLQEKTGFDPINNADSMTSRTNGIRKVGKAGKEIQKFLDIEDDGPDTFHHTSEPMKMMDLVFQDWEGDQANGDAPGVEDDDHVEIDDTEDEEEDDDDDE